VYEIAYALYGRKAIFFVCIIQYILNFAAIILYYILLGDCFEQLSSSVSIGNTQQDKIRGPGTKIP